MSVIPEREAFRDSEQIPAGTFQIQASFSNLLVNPSLHHLDFRSLTCSWSRIPVTVSLDLMARRIYLHWFAWAVCIAICTSWCLRVHQNAQNARALTCLTSHASMSRWRRKQGRTNYLRCWWIVLWSLSNKPPTYHYVYRCSFEFGQLSSYWVFASCALGFV